MKKSVLFLIALTIPLAAFVQKVSHPFYNGNVSTYFAPRKTSPGEDKLDSIDIYQLYSSGDSSLIRKYDYAYNAAGNMTLAKYSSRYYNTKTETMSEWEMMDRYQYDYDLNGNLVFSQIKVPDETYEMKTLYYYDKDNRRELEKYFRSEALIIWDTLGYREISYDENNRLKSEVEYGPDIMKIEYSYDPAGMISYVDKYYYEGSPIDWLLEVRKEYFYDEENKLANYKEYGIYGNPALFLCYEELYYYDDYGILEAVEEYRFNYGSETSYYTTRKEYSYDEYGNISGINEYELSGEEWINDRQKIYSYDADSNILLYEEYMWYNNEWKGYSKYDYSYNDRGMLSTVTGYMFDSDWVPDKHGYYYYSTFTASSNEPAVYGAPLIYPNPSGNVLYIDMIDPQKAELKVYSVDGRMVFSAYLTESTHRLYHGIKKPGVYIINFTTGKTTYTRKIIIE